MSLLRETCDVAILKGSKEVKNDRLEYGLLLFFHSKL